MINRIEKEWAEYLNGKPEPFKVRDVNATAVFTNEMFLTHINRESNKMTNSQRAHVYSQIQMLLSLVADKDSDASNIVEFLALYLNGDAMAIKCVNSVIDKGICAH